MKHLRGYKIFESVDKDTIKDILSYISDDLYVEVHDIRYKYMVFIYKGCDDRGNLVEFEVTQRIIDEIKELTSQIKCSIEIVFIKKNGNDSRIFGVENMEKYIGSRIGQITLHIKL